MMLRLLSLAAVFVLFACMSKYETDLSRQKEWEKLGAYHGEQGYREWDQARLNKQGALNETDYEQYRAGYLKGRFEYCSGKKNVSTVLNQGYPDECSNGQSSYGLIDRGY